LAVHAASLSPIKSFLLVSPLKKFKPTPDAAQSSMPEKKAHPLLIESSFCAAAIVEKVYACCV
jgi:hypothetical protein